MSDRSNRPAPTQQLKTSGVGVPHRESIHHLNAPATPSADARVCVEQLAHTSALHCSHHCRHQIVSPLRRSSNTVNTDSIYSRIAYMINDRICLIGMKAYAIAPMLAVELTAQLVLTLRFLVPLFTIHRKGNGLLHPLRNAVLRTLIGCAITMLLNIAVKLGLLLFDGMPVWLCFLTCKVEGMYPLESSSQRGANCVLRSVPCGLCSPLDHTACTC